MRKYEIAPERERGREGEERERERGREREMREGDEGGRWKEIQQRLTHTVQCWRGIQ